MAALIEVGTHVEIKIWNGHREICYILGILFFSREDLENTGCAALRKGKGEKSESLS